MSWKRKDVSTMIIDSSKVGMASSRTYSSAAVYQTETMNAKSEQAVLLDLSDESKTLMEQMKDIKNQQEEEKSQKQKQNMEDLLKNGIVGTKKSEQGTIQAKSKEEMQLEVLRKMLEALRNMRYGNRYQMQKRIRQLGTMMRDSQWQKTQNSDNANTEMLQEAAQLHASSASAAGGTWMTKQTVTSAFVSEKETTAYTAQGVVHTADGRDISFGVSLEMSRAFAAKYETYTKEDYLLVDPLVINMDASVTEVSDQKFYFDLDADGKEEEISFVGKGSGFLALDKNGDGTINDGSELFGTQSGDGFKDLAAYDKDGNGWIDEADDIFKDLKVWTKDEEGNNKLLNLKEAGVGAIYLGSADTQFSLNNEQNKTNAVIRKTGIYLKESGEVGTVQHVDFAL